MMFRATSVFIGGEPLPDGYGVLIEWEDPWIPVGLTAPKKAVSSSRQARVWLTKRDQRGEYHQYKPLYARHLSGHDKEGRKFTFDLPSGILTITERYEKGEQ